MILQGKTKNSKSVIKKFFFPFSPFKSFKSIRLLFLMAILISLRIALGMLSIRVAPFGLSISIAGVPLMVIGGYFGPIVGFLIGIITDTISFLMAGGGIGFWLYAIQEPIVGLLSGLIAGWCRHRQSKEHLNITLDIIFNQIAIVVFAVLCYVTLIYGLDSSHNHKWYNPDFQKFYEIYRGVVVGGVSLLIAVYEILVCLTLTKKIGKNDHRMMINFVYATTLVLLVMFVFSIALGPIIAVEYAKFISGGVVPDEYLKFGSLFYLVPRIAIESIKVPLESICLFGVVCLFDKKVSNIINKMNNCG